MKHLMAGILIAALAAVPLFGGFGYVSAVTFTGATGATQTNITLLFSFSDAKLKTAANGGQIQNLCSRNGTNVPCDFIFTDDPTCASVTGGYKWGFDGDYSAAAGTGHGWVMIPSYTTSGVAPTVCIGNSAVSTYQGGAAGAEFDAATVAAWHLSNGVSLSAVDFSASGNNGTVTAVNAATGKTDGGANLAGALTAQINKTSATGLPTATTAHWTISGWQKTSSYVSLSQVFGFGPTLSATSPTGAARYLLQFNNNYYWWGFGADWDTGIAYDSDSAWHHWEFTFDGTTLAFYRDGTQRATRTGLPAGATTAGTTITAGSGHTAAASGPNTVLDDARIATESRTANWIATEYANQDAPPAIGAFTPLSGGTQTGGGAQGGGAAVY